MKLLEKLQSQWIIKVLLILATLMVIKGQNPHDVIMLLQVILPTQH